MKITACHIQNFKRIEDISIAPDADRTLVLLGGKNAQGKSSVLDALTAAFGGKRAEPTDPIRHGADAAEIRVELDGGELTIRRVITASGSAIEVRDRIGAVKSPQAVLDKLVGARFLDPLAFLQLAAKEQRAQLMRLIEGADRIAGLNEKRQRAFDRRTEVGRDLTKAKGELARLPEVKVEQPIDIAALNEEVRQLAEQQRAGDGLGRAYEQCVRETDAARKNLEDKRAEMRRIQAEIERLQDKLEDLSAQAESWAGDVDKCEQVAADAKAKLDAAAAKWSELAPQRAQLDADLARANEHNRAVFAAEAANKRRAEAAAEVEKLAKETEQLTGVIATIDTRKAEILGAAKLPVDGLGIADDGIELDGVPFSQASDAERWRVALALAIAAAPGLADVWIRDGALLDEESLARVAEHAAAAGKRVWIERVGTRDPGVIVISDGKVAVP